MSHEVCAPEWVDPAGLKAGWGIGRSQCYKLIREGKIRSITLRREGCLRGKRLIEILSVRELLASCESGIDPALSEQLRRARCGQKPVQ